jgi:peptidoglycan hydrolase-like protein with peptidoglycan-binding domain
MAALRAQVAIDLAKLRGGGTGGDPGHGGGGTSGHQVVTLHRELLVRTPMQHGDDVKAVQRIVGAKPDGWYGPMTASAVRIWQRRHGLVSDGIVGPKTAASLSLHWAG